MEYISPINVEMYLSAQSSYYIRANLSLFFSKVNVSYLRAPTLYHGHRYEELRYDCCSSKMGFLFSLEASYIASLRDGGRSIGEDGFFEGRLCLSQLSISAERVMGVNGFRSFFKYKCAVGR